MANLYLYVRRLHGRTADLAEMNKSTSTSLLAPIWKRKWMILIVGLVCGVGSYVYYKHEPAVYSATTTLNLAASEEQEASQGLKSGTKSKASVADAPALIMSAVNAKEAKRIMRAEGKKVVKGKVKAKPSANAADIIQILAEAHGAKNVVRLANAYANAFILRQNRTSTEGVQAAITTARKQLKRIEVAAAHSSKSGGGGGVQVIQEATLASKINQLESQLHQPGVTQLTPAGRKTTELVEPMPKQSAIFGFLLGVLIAIFVAYGLERIDRSLRDIEHVESQLGGPLLAALPLLQKPLLMRDGTPGLPPRMLDSLRRANATLGALEAAGSKPPKTILCTSPDPGDGKSTFMAALALVKAEMGERVALLETDFRKPTQAQKLGLEGEYGLADVLTGRRTLAEAMQTVPLGQPVAETVAVPGGEGGAAPAVAAQHAGSISALVGTTEENRPPLTGAAFGNLLKSLADEYDCVLVDVETELEAADTIALLREVDGIILIGRVGHSRDASIERLDEVLALPGTAPLIGTVANCVTDRDLENNGLWGVKRKRATQQSRKNSKRKGK